LGLIVIEYPLVKKFMAKKRAGEKMNPARLISEAKFADSLMRNAASAIADLILVYKKVFDLFGYSIRLTDVLDRTTFWKYRLKRTNVAL